MSFSSDVKTELAEILPTEPHCLRAELSAFLINENGLGAEEKAPQKNCCKRAFLRGMFLSGGSVADPEKLYQLEISCCTEKLSLLVQKCMEEFEIHPKTVVRNGKYVVYLKDGDQIADFLAAVQAAKAVLKLENVRVYKEIGNHTNRKVNCETANSFKQVEASLKQIRNIEKIEQTIGLDSLPETLRQAALIRKAHPEATLSELTAYFDPPIQKSGINHRLRRLDKIAGEETE